MEPIRGIIPPLVTPLNPSRRLDSTALHRLLDHLLTGGVHGLFALGTTGEAPCLDYATRREIIKLVCSHLDGRIPVLVGITDTSIDECRALADFAALAGADALVLAPPFYFPATQSEISAFLERLIPRLPLPVYLYNIPSLTKVPYEVETVRLAFQLPGCAGLKDSSGDMHYFKAVRAVLPPHKSLLCGPEEFLVESMHLGGDGGICGGANLFPSLYVRLYEAVRANDLATIDDLHQTVMRISRGVYAAAEGPSSYMRGLKCALACLGLCGDMLAEPFQPLDPAARRSVQDCLDHLAAAPTL